MFIFIFIPLLSEVNGVPAYVLVAYVSHPEGKALPDILLWRRSEPTACLCGRRLFGGSRSALLKEKLVKVSQV